jgi:hypothetical protein
MNDLRRSCIQPPLSFHVIRYRLTQQIGEIEMTGLMNIAQELRQEVFENAKVLLAGKSESKATMNEYVLSAYDYFVSRVLTMIQVRTNSFDFMTDDAIYSALVELHKNYTNDEWSAYQIGLAMHDFNYMQCRQIMGKMLQSAIAINQILYQQGEQTSESSRQDEMNL